MAIDKSYLHNPNDSFEFEWYIKHLMDGVNYAEENNHPPDNCLDISEIDKGFPSRGVYFLMNNNKCVYIGQSVNMLSRIAKHQEDNKKVFDDVLFYVIHAVDLSQYERLFIYALSPDLNINHNLNHTSRMQ